jgi:selenoprotein W-related protein
MDAATTFQAWFGIEVHLVPRIGGVFDIKISDRLVAKHAKGHAPDTNEIVVAVARLREANKYP